MKKTLFILLLIVALATSLTAVPRSKVIVEIGTGTWCQYCPGAAMGADELVENGHQVAIIENHNGDPYAYAGSNARNSYYGITGYPTANFDGLNPSVGGSNTASMYNNYLPRVNARLAIPSHFNITAGGESVGNDFSITVTIDKTEADTNANLVFHCVVTESDIQVAWQGQTECNFVSRLMAPSQSGTPVNFGAETQVTIPLTFTMNPAWVMANCELVLFLQNSVTKEILQGTKYSLAEIGGAYPVSLDHIDFPETYLTGSAIVPMTIHNYWNITAAGSITSSNPVFGVTPATRLDYSIPPYQSRTFNVAFAPTTVGAQTGNLTITSNMPDYASMVIPMTGTGFANVAPVVNNVLVSGVPVVSMTVTGEYNFTDGDADTEGATLLQWYRVTNGTPAPIDGANAITYHLLPADIGNAVAFQVTPVDQHGMAGTSVMSPPSATIEVLPPPQNLTAQVVNDQDAVLTWEAPIHFSRNFLGYRIFRSGLIVNTIMNPSTLTWTDTWLMDGDYEYWVTSIFDNPIAQSEPSNVVSVHIGPEGNSENVNALVESVQIYPNPVRSTSTILIKAKANSPVAAQIYNTKGQMVETLKGMTGTDGVSGLALSVSDNMIPGVYFVKVNSSKGSIVNKIVLMK